MIDLIRGIWSDAYPPDEPRQRTFLEKALLILLVVIRAFSLSNLGNRFTGRLSYNFIDAYVLAWLLGLAATLVFGWYRAGWIVACIAAYRVLDIISFQLCILLIDSQKSSWRLASLQRTVLFSFLNFAEIVAAYAIIYLSVGRITQPSSGAALGTPLHALYFSLVTMATVGYGDFVPNSDGSRIIVVAELLTEALFVLAIVPSFVTNAAAHLDGRQLNRLDGKK